MNFMLDEKVSNAKNKDQYARTCTYVFDSNEDVENCKIEQLNGLTNGYADERTQLQLELEDNTIRNVKIRRKSDTIREPNRLTTWQKLKMTLWQFIPVYCASMTCFSFGNMLGWPSPTYPNLLTNYSDTNNSTHHSIYLIAPSFLSAPAEPSSFNPLPITLVQSPLIAGFLMFGTAFTIPFSSHTFHTVRYSLMVSFLIITFGWLILWSASNIYHLLLSRFIIGMGNGFAIGQIKIYIKETSPLGSYGNSVFLLKSVNLLMILGIICAYTMGIYLKFRQFALAAVLISLGGYVSVAFIPDTPKDLIKLGRLQRSEKMQRRLGVFQADENDLTNEEIGPPGVLSLLRNTLLRHKVMQLTILTFIQQFTGAPATIVYCQFLLEQLNIPYPPYISLVYICTYFLAYIIGTFYISPHVKSKRSILLASLLMLNLALFALILIIYYNTASLTTPYLPLIPLLLYIFTNGIGLATAPNTMVEYLNFGKYHIPASQFQLMIFCVFAVIITKLFQVFFAAFEIYCIFILFMGVGMVGIVFVWCCIPKKPETVI